MAEANNTNVDKIVRNKTLFIFLGVCWAHEHFDVQRPQTNNTHKGPFEEKMEARKIGSDKRRNLIGQFQFLHKISIRYLL